MKPERFDATLMIWPRNTKKMKKCLTLQFQPSNFCVVAKTFTDKNSFFGSDEISLTHCGLTVDETRKGAQLGNHAN